MLPSALGVGLFVKGVKGVGCLVNVGFNVVVNVGFNVGCVVGNAVGSSPHIVIELFPLLRP